MSAASLAELLVEYDRARAYTRDLWSVRAGRRPPWNG
jgi:hypothetical protein